MIFQQQDRFEEDNAESMLSRGDLRFEKGNPERALTCYKIARRLTKNKQNLHVFYSKIGRACAAMKKFEEAIDNYKEAEKYVPSRQLANILVEIGHLYCSKGDFRTSVNYFRKAISQQFKPDFVGDVLYWCGEVLSQVPELDKNDELLHLLDKAKSEKRRLVMTWEIHNTKGHVLNHKERWEDARQEFEATLGYSEYFDIPGNVYIGMGKCLENLNRREEAVKYYRMSTDELYLDTAGKAHEYIGRLLQDTNPDLAEEELRKAKELFEIAKAKKIIPEGYADKFLFRIDIRLDNIQQKRKSLKSSPTIQFFGPVGVGINMGVISQINQTIGGLKQEGLQDAADALQNLAESISKSQHLDSSKKNELIGTFEQIGKEIKKPKESRDKSKKITLERIKSTLSGVTDVAQVAAKMIDILLPYF